MWLEWLNPYVWHSHCLWCWPLKDCLKNTMNVTLILCANTWSKNVCDRLTAIVVSAYTTLSIADFTIVFPKGFHFLEMFLPKLNGNILHIPVLLHCNYAMKGY